jgi:yecA family protein
MKAKWRGLEETLMSYGHDDASVIDVSELDGMLTAVLSGPVVVEPDAWLVAVWGGEKYIPRWKNDREMNRFIDLCFKHMNDIAERLSEYPDQFEPMFGYNDVTGELHRGGRVVLRLYARRGADGLVSLAGRAEGRSGCDCAARYRREQR